jgi:hypothetical protein
MNADFSEDSQQPVTHQIPIFWREDRKSIVNFIAQAVRLYRCQIRQMLEMLLNASRPNDSSLQISSWHGFTSITKK